MRWEGYVPSTKGERNAYKIVVGYSKRKISFRNIRRRWTDNIKTALQVLGMQCVLDSSSSLVTALANTAMNLLVS
jgi:hypothetical protein